MSESNLPNGWAEATIEYICNILDSNRIPLNSKERSSRKGGYPYYGANGQVDSIDDYIFNGEHILVAEDGGFFDQPGKAVAYIVDGKFWVNNHAHILSLKANMSALWLQSFLNTIDWMPHVSGSTRLKLTQGKLRNIAISIPPLNEQHRIAAKIEALQAHSAKAKKALEEAQCLLEKFRQSALAAAFRGDLTASWREEHPDTEPASVFLQRIRQERRKRWEETELVKYATKGKTPPKDWKKKYPEPVAVNTEGLPDLPNGWCWTSLDEIITTINAGKNFLCQERPPQNEELGLVKISAVTWRFFDENASKTVTDHSLVNLENIIKRGDLLISRANTLDLVGATVIVDNITKKLYLTDKVLRINTVIDNKVWIHLFLSSYLGRTFIQMKSSGNQESMRNISQYSIKSIPVPLPAELELKKIVQVLCGVLSRQDNLKKRVDELSELLVSIPPSIHTKAFRGELVAQDPTDEPAGVLLERIAAETAVLSASDAKSQQARRGRKPKSEVAQLTSFPAPGREQRLLRLMEYIISAYPGLSTIVVEERAKLATYPAVCARLLSSRASTFRKALRESGEGWKFSKADVVRFGRLWESLEANYGIRISSEGLCTMREGRKPEPWPSMDTLLPFFNKAYTIFTAERHNHQDIQADLDSIGVMQKIA